MRYIVMFFGLLSMLGCSNRGNDSAIYGSFLVRYMEQGNQIKATASFFEGDTLRTARPKAWEGGVSFLGSAMKMRNMVDSEFRYTTERNIDFMNDAIGGSASNALLCPPTFGYTIRQGPGL